MYLQRPRLPLEFEREIFLSLKDEPDVYHYVLVAKRVQVWLQPYISYKIVLPNQSTAKRYLTFLQNHPSLSDYKVPVTVLFLGAPVNVGTAALILRRCQRLTTLTIRFTYHHIPCAVKNPLYLPLLELKDLKRLYIGLTVFYTSRMVYLPNMEVLNRLTHLHLSSSGMASISIPLGFAGLANLTHLSMSWSVGRSCTPHLREFLDKSSSVILIQWIEERHSPSDVEVNLRMRELVDRRIVVLSAGLVVHHENSNDVWLFAERLVQWRVNNETDAFATPRQGSWNRGETFLRKW